jgi:hypothetical protein
MKSPRTTIIPHTAKLATRAAQVIAAGISKVGSIPRLIEVVAEARTEEIEKPKVKSKTRVFRFGFRMSPVGENN